MRAARLVSLLLILQARGQATARELARELEVSVRTVHRDIEALSGGGVPIYAERGAGGGFRLLPGYRLAVNTLTHEEAEVIALLGHADLARDLGLDASHISAARKIRDALPEEHRQLADGAARWLLVEEPQPTSSPTTAHVRALADAARTRRVVRVTTHDRKPFEWHPLGLVHSADAWHAIGHEDRSVHALRVDTVIAITSTPQFFEEPARFDLAATWAALRSRE